MCFVNRTNNFTNLFTDSSLLKTLSIPNPNQSIVSPEKKLNIPFKDNSSFNNKGNALSSLGFIEQPTFIEYKVKHGDTLEKISKEYLGKSDKYKEIYQDNRDVLNNPNDLRVGMTIKIPLSPEQFNKVSTPKVTTENHIQQNKELKEITVKKGDSLSILALEHLGNADKYMEIFEVNQDILKTPGSLKVGMKLKIPVSSKKSSDFENLKINIPDNIPDVSGMTPGAQSIYKSLKNYQEYHNKLGNDNRTKTTENEIKEISIELDKAGKALGVDPKIMLAVYAHESGGFNPKARSHTGAGGLGQLTGIAIRQVQFMAGMSKGQEGEAPFNQYKENFITNSNNLSQRYNIKKNIWTSTAYMAYEIKDRNNGNVKKALERYGDPNVSTYENKVNKEYKTLFGKNLF